MKKLFIFFGLFLVVNLLLGCQHLDQTANTSSEEAVSPRPLVFAWPFLEPGAMVSRGGTSQGGDVTLAIEPDWRWQSIQDGELDALELDRLAILAMEGNYRTSFQFTETAGFTDDYAPARPYFSWGTEHVSVIEDTGTFISLQHTLVMYFEDESGEIMGPMVMKHWRQDWSYQETDLHVYKGNNIWTRQRLRPEDVRGAWTQAVFQVDDSPRYEVIGRWEHGKRFSSWNSLTSDRPLPRREHSVRDDYNVLSGEHRITMVPTGWVHEQHNRKVFKNGDTQTFIAQEVGVNRYERITDPDLSAADISWSKTAGYWEAVRSTWRSVFEEYDTFQIKSEVNGEKLWQVHFGHASEIEQSSEDQSEDWESKVEHTIDRFLNTGDAIETAGDY